MKMQQIKTVRLNNSIAKELKVGDEVLLEVVPWNGKSKFFNIVIKDDDVVMQRCDGCTCFLRKEKDKYKYKKEILCIDCYNTRTSK